MSKRSRGIGRALARSTQIDEAREAHTMRTLTTKDGNHRRSVMFVRWSAAIAAMTLLSGAALAEGAKLTDPQIAHIAYTAGVIDVTAGKQALTKASNKEVKAFAENMVRDHEAVNKQALDLVKKLNVTPEDNDTSKALSKQAADKLAELGKLSGAAFDHAYIAPTRSPTTKQSTARSRRS